jgi:hypothetical protein
LRGRQGGIGPPPDHLDEATAALWRQLAARLPEGVGNRHDGPSFELLVAVMAKLRSGKFSAADCVQLRSLLHDFGMNPSSHLRASMPPPDLRPNKLQEFLNDAPRLRRKRGLASFLPDD